MNFKGLLPHQFTVAPFLAHHPSHSSHFSLSALLAHHLWQGWNDPLGTCAESFSRT